MDYFGSGTTTTPPRPLFNGLPLGPDGRNLDGAAVKLVVSAADDGATTATAKQHPVSPTSEVYLIIKRIMPPIDVSGFSIAKARKAAAPRPVNLAPSLAAVNDWPRRRWSRSLAAWRFNFKG